MILLFVSTAIIAQNAFITVDTTQISKEDFVHSQKKSLELLGVNETIDNYLNFAVLRKMALDNNAENDNRFLREYSQGLRELQDSLYFPQEILDKELHRAFLRFQQEKKVQFLAVKTKAEAEKIRIQLINKQITFDTAIENFSLDKSFLNPKYILPYYVTENLENAIYSLKKDEISYAIPYFDSYVLIKLLDERPYLGNVYLGAISIPTTVENSKNNIQEAYKELNNGKSFEEVAKKYSQNKNTIDGVNLSPINFDFPEALYQQVVNLQKNQYSNPFEFGNQYHIIRMNRKTDMKNFEEAKPLIKDFFKESIKAKEIEKMYIIEPLKKTSYYYENAILKGNTAEKIKTIADKSQVIFRVDKVEYSAKNLSDSLTSILKTKPKGTTDNNWIDLFLEMKKDDELLDFYKNYYFYRQANVMPLVDSLKKTALANLAFDIITEKGYNDEQGMQEYIIKNAKNYTWNERGEGQVYYCANTQIAEELKKMIKNKKSAKEIATFYKDKTDSKGNVQVFVFDGKMEQKYKDFPANAKLKKGLQQVEHKGKIALVNFANILKPELKTVEEARQEIAEPYQYIFMQKTLQDLKQQTKIQIDEKIKKELQQIYKP